MKVVSVFLPDLRESHVEHNMRYEAELNYLAAEHACNVTDLMAAMAMAESDDSFDSYSVDVVDEIRVDGSNLENADFDNPHGYNYVRVYSLRAVNRHGYTRCYGNYSSSEQAMNAFDFGLVPPVSEWNEGRPVYGSLAYQVEGIEEEEARLERSQDSCWDPWD